MEYSQNYDLYHIPHFAILEPLDPAGTLVYKCARIIRSGYEFDSLTCQTVRHGDD